MADTPDHAPEDVVESSTQDYKKEVSSEDIKKFLIGLDYQKVNLADYRERNYYSNIVASLLSVKADRDNYYKTLEQIKSFYLVQLIIDVLCDDALTEDSLSSAIIDVSVVDTKNQEEYTKELRDLFKKFSLPTTIEDIIEDLLLYGEYCLEMSAEKGKGITEILDSVIGNSVIALYESNFPKIFYRLEGQKYTAHPLNKYAHFCIDSRKIKVPIPKELRRENLELKTPIFRIGRSVFYGSLEKIRELYMLEKAISANTFFGLTSGNIVSISMPSSMPITDMMEITRKYESLLNSTKISSVDINDVNQVVNAIKDSFSVKVIPNFSDKGALEKVDVVSNNQAKEGLLPSIQDARTSVAQTIGVPVELLFGEGSQSRRSSLKQYVRYARKIKSVQRAIQNGLKQICLNHIANKYQDADISADNIVINMYTDTNIDEIDNLEGVQLIIQGLKDLTDLFTAVKDAPVLGLDGTDFVDPGKFLKYLQSTLKSAGFRSSDIITIPNKIVPAPPMDMGGEEPSGEEPPPEGEEGING